MSIEKVRAYFKSYGIDHKIREFSVSSATVELAAKAVETQPSRICKTLSFAKDEGCILIQVAGDKKIKNGRFKKEFGMKGKMLSPDRVEELTGYPVGGVCAFAVDNPKVEIYADVSLKNYETVFPACGSENSAIELTPDELFKYSKAIKWVDLTN